MHGHLETHVLIGGGHVSRATYSMPYQHSCAEV
jgi:hypothetical protein